MKLKETLNRKSTTTKFLKAIGILSFACLNAQQTTSDFLKNTTISGYADLFYKYDLANNGNNTKTAFTVPQNSLEPEMFDLKFVNTSGQFSATADIGFGSKEEIYNYTDEKTRFMIKQLFIDYNPTEKLKFTAGSWATHIGYEYIDSPDNDIYSMSYAFSYGPYYHTGLKGNYTFGKFNLMAGIANPTDLKSSFEKITYIDANGNLVKASYQNKYFIWQLGYTSDKFSAYFNGQLGSNNPLDSNITQFDGVAIYNVTDKLKFGANATFASISYDSNAPKQNWSSLVGYAKYKFSDLIALNYRAEYVNNKDGYLALGQTMGNTVFANTISATLSKSRFMLKPEFRYEHSSQNIYWNKAGTPVDHAANFLVGFIYKL